MRSSTTFQVGHKKLGGFIKGSSHTEQAKKKVSASLYGKRGKLSRRWLGDLAGYTAIHAWVNKTLGKAKDCKNLDCQKLPATRFEWASLSGECKRDVTDYASLCTPCHRRFDNGNLTIRLTDGSHTREKFLICEKCNHKNII